MDKRNFDSLKGIKAPQAWIDRAAAIPATAEKRRALPIYRVTAAASFVLVGLIGLLVFLLYGNNSAPIAVQDRPDATAATEDVGFVGVTESDMTQSGTHEETLFPTVGQGSADPRLPTGTPTDTTVDASETQIPPTSATGTEPTEKSTADRPALTTETTAPTGTPTVPPTAPPVLPTAPPPTNPPATVPPTQAPTEGEMPNSEGLIGFYAVFPASLLKEGESVYCVFWRQGYPSTAEIGDGQQAYYYIQKDSMVYAGYETTVISENAPHPVVYEYIFYNSRRQLLARGTEEFLI